MRRFLKQFIYSLFYFSILAVIAAGIYYFYLIPEPTCFDNIQNQNELGVDCSGPCIDCELKTLTLEVDEPLVFEAGQFKSTILAKIINPSVNYGLNDFEYEFQIFSSFGTILSRLQGRSYILTDESKYLIVPAIDIDSRDISKVILNIPEEKWEVKSNLLTYELRFKNIKILPSQKTVQISGSLTNDSPKSFSSLTLVGIVFDKEGNEKNASTTKIDNVSAFSETPFVIFFPNMKNIGEINLNDTRGVFYEIER